MSAAILALKIDTREADWILRWAVSPPLILASAMIVNEQLPTGDCKVFCADGITLNIERKTPSDFLSSIPNDHIFDQVERMMQERRESGEFPFLVITGEILRNPATGNCIIPGSKHGDGWNWHAVQGALLSIQEAGVPVIFCAGDVDYPACLERLAKRNHHTMIINPTREITPLTPQERVLCAFDGIGPALAAEILERCSTLAWALDYLCDLDPASPKIPGIAFGRKQIIVKTLQLEDGNSLKVTAK
jgi:ERCC4-type nuclease